MEQENKSAAREAAAAKREVEATRKALAQARAEKDALVLRLQVRRRRVKLTMENRKIPH